MPALGTEPIQKKNIDDAYAKIDMKYNSIQSSGISISKIFFVGTLVNYSINETNFDFGSHNLRVLTFDYYRAFGFLHLWGVSYYHYKAIIFGYEGMVDFHGILRPHFICGMLG